MSLVLPQNWSAQVKARRGPHHRGRSQDRPSFLERVFEGPNRPWGTGPRRLFGMSSSLPRVLQGYRRGHCRTFPCPAAAGSGWAADGAARVQPVTVDRGSRTVGSPPSPQPTRGIVFTNHVAPERYPDQSDLSNGSGVAGGRPMGMVGRTSFFAAPQAAAPCT